MCSSYRSPRRWPQLTPHQWVENILRPIGTRLVVVGENYRFGHRAGGDARTLCRMGFDVDVVTINGGMFSTRTRGLVRSGEFDAAARPLGRPCELEGTVLPGARPGRLSLATGPGGLLPPSGTYTGWAIDRRTLVTVGTAVGRIELQFPGPVPAAPSSRLRLKLILSDIATVPDLAHRVAF